MEVYECVNATRLITEKMITEYGLVEKKNNESYTYLTIADLDTHP